MGRVGCGGLEILGDDGEGELYNDRDEEVNGEGFPYC